MHKNHFFFLIFWTRNWFVSQCVHSYGHKSADTLILEELKGESPFVTFEMHFLKKSLGFLCATSQKGTELLFFLM